MSEHITRICEQRRSIRQYQDKPIPKEILDKVLSNVILCPTAGNQQSYHVYCITNKDIISKIAHDASGQLWIETAPCVLVFCQDPQRAGDKYGARGHDVFGIQDATIAQSFALFAAYEQELASCWVGGFSVQKVQEIVNIPEPFEPLGILTLGFAAAGPRSDRHRREFDEVISYVE
ncbi:hypothetical protein WA158_004593 [Blastocystis sp. Blastoise]